MRTAVTAMALGLVLASSATNAVEEADFKVMTTRNLVNLCSAPESDPMHGAAMGYCLGFVDGASDYHDVVTSGDMVAPVACPGHETTRKEVVDAFLAWARKNDAMLDEEAPIQGLMRAASETWPCS